MGEKQIGPFQPCLRRQVSFNAFPQGGIDFQGSRVTSDGDLTLVRELDERLGFGELIEQPAAAGPTLGGSEVAQSFDLLKLCGSSSEKAADSPRRHADAVWKHGVQDRGATGLDY